MGFPPYTPREHFLKDPAQPEQNGPFLLYSVLESLVCGERWESAACPVWRPLQEEIMAQAQGLGRRYIKAFFKGFFVAVPVTVTFLDRVACVARVEGASMQPSLNPGERQVSDVVLLNHWSIRNYEVQRGDIVSLVLTSRLTDAIIRNNLMNIIRNNLNYF
ncbi:mitochondrial inner membrane protease subunit 2 isoform X11 [Lepidochelys kempii]|uniref:mitochondrial inner membrane protease subunit 2 isoform X11 n=1 Tax=Lepidochelys kempii TaxID=8472 RepID=UPI003C6F5918